MNVPKILGYIFAIIAIPDLIFMFAIFKLNSSISRYEEQIADSSLKE